MPKTHQKHPIFLNFFKQKIHIIGKYTTFLGQITTFIGQKTTF
jgi:hypothetical protein